MQPPPDFDLAATIRSHGWSDLPPFESDAERTRLLIRTPAGIVKASEGRIHAPGRELRAVAASCLRFELDLSGFWAMCAEDPDLAWVPEMRAGRFLRAPTAFADAVMILATTNCTWALTRRMLRRLVDRYGENGAFPSRERLARVRSFGFGYRDPYLKALVRGPDLERYREDERDTAVIRRELLERPGFGPYAADCFLRTIGRFEHYAEDSWTKKRFHRYYPRRRSIDRRFGKFGKWRGLAFWLALTRHWYEGPWSAEA